MRQRTWHGGPHRAPRTQPLCAQRGGRGRPVVSMMLRALLEDSQSAGTGVPAQKPRQAGTCQCSHASRCERAERCLGGGKPVNEGERRDD